MVSITPPVTTHDKVINFLKTSDRILSHRSQQSPTILTCPPRKLPPSLKNPPPGQKKSHFPQKSVHLAPSLPQHSPNPQHSQPPSIKKPTFKCMNTQHTIESLTSTNSPTGAQLSSQIRGFITAHLPGEKSLQNFISTLGTGHLNCKTF